MIYPEIEEHVWVYLIQTEPNVETYSDAKLYLKNISPEQKLDTYFRAGIYYGDDIDCG